jgi:hypothetical protein
VTRTAAVGVALALVLLPGAALATMSSGTAKAHSINTATLAPATNPAVNFGTCTVAVKDSLVITWTPTTSSWADGYIVARSLLSTGPFVTVGTVSGQSTATFTDTPLLFSTTYYYVVRATKNNWRSADTATVSKTTRSLTCT